MDVPLEGFSARARKAVSLAKEEARRFDHNYVGNEHLLLGLAREGEGIAAKALASLGIDVPRLREALIKWLARGEGPVDEDLALTLRAQKVLALAAEEVTAMYGSHQGAVGTEHVLLALVRPDDAHEAGWIAQQLLESLGADPERVRRQVLQVLADSRKVPRTRDNVVTCRVDDSALAALDALVEAGVYTTRSEAAARLIVAGIEANGPLLAKVSTAVAEIRRVRAQAQALTQDWKEAPSLALAGHVHAAVSPPAGGTGCL